MFTTQSLHCSSKVKEILVKEILYFIAISFNTINNSIKIINTNSNPYICQTSTISMISLVRESERKECQLITPFPSHNFTYQSAWLWNKFKSVNRSINFSLTTIKIKNILKYSLLEAQNTYGDNWCEYNFTKFAKIDKD